MKDKLTIKQLLKAKKLMDNKEKKEEIEYFWVKLTKSELKFFRDYLKKEMKK